MEAVKIISHFNNLRHPTVHSHNISFQSLISISCICHTGTLENYRGMHLCEGEGGIKMGGEREREKGRSEGERDESHR